MASLERHAAWRRASAVQRGHNLGYPERAEMLALMRRVKRAMVRPATLEMYGARWGLSHLRVPAADALRELVFAGSVWHVDTRGNSTTADLIIEGDSGERK